MSQTNFMYPLLLLCLVSTSHNRTFKRGNLKENLISLDNILNTVMDPPGMEMKESVSKYQSDVINHQDDEDEVSVETVDEESVSINDKTIDEVNHYLKESMFKSGPESHAQDRSAPTRNLNIVSVNIDDSIQDIYNREELPRVSRILSSGNASMIDKLIQDTKNDPFAIVSRDIKYHELLGADLIFAFLYKVMIYFIGSALALPAVIEILVVLEEEFLKLFV